MPYSVALDAFHGPLDLLLYLVKRSEVDVLDISIAAVADQFRDYLQVMGSLDLEIAGDFLVMAYTLMEIKSRAILSTDAADPADSDRPDPRAELVKQLLEYRRFKDAAAALEERAGLQGARVARHEPPDAAPAAGPVVKPVELWDLVSAFARLVRETQAAGATVAVDDTPQHVYEARIKDRVAAEGRVRFLDVFTPPHHKARLIGIFLAVLELIRHHGLGLDQPDPAGDIWLVPPGPRPDGE
ncbi:MAG TPA: segregation/condensation protein A [Urbifossiella sp.]|jgi:segregation and condensation protein A|nr:segregation/condensation protein A [Urbifossiella sp.]